MNTDPFQLPSPDPSLLGRLFLLLQAALRQPILSADDALLADELGGRRKGNAKLLGVAFSLAHRRGWIAPLPAPSGQQVAKKSRRVTRASGSSQLWTGTAKTAEAFRRVERQLVNRPKPRDLFDELD